MKSLWITALKKEQNIVQPLIATANQYGLQGDGHFWQDDLAKMAWLPVKEQLLNPQVTLWVIVGEESDLSPETRYGLTLLTLLIQREKPALPILWLDPSNNLAQDTLPGVFSNIPLLPTDSATLGAKFAAMANIPAKQGIPPYRLNVHANPGFGVWFEIGPGSSETWQGALFGTSGAAIEAHGVGSSGKIPEKCILEYPVKNMELQSGTSKYTAWGVSNSLTKDSSYYIKVNGTADALIFGAMIEGEEADLHVLKI